MLHRRKSPPVSRNRSTVERARPGAFSYYARRSAYDFNTGREMQREDRQVAERQSRFARSSRYKQWSAIAFTLVVFCLMTYISTQPVVRLASVRDDANASLLQPASVYEPTVKATLSSSFLNHSKLTLQQRQIADAVKSQFPEIGSVTVVAPVFGSHPTVYIEPVNPVLVVTGSNGQYVVNDSGVVIAPVSHLTSALKLHLPLVDDVGSGPLAVGQQAFTSENVTFIHTVATELTAKHLSISRLTLPKGTAELDVYLSGYPTYVKFNLENTKAREQAGTFLAVWTSLQHQKVTASYIDVRVAGRAYYK